MPHKILVIDETPSASLFVQSSLSGTAYDVDILLAHHEVDAFERFEVTRPDLIVLSDSPPELDAEAICRRLLNDPSTSPIPVLLLAANSDRETIGERCRNVAGTFSKPIESESFRQVVQSALRRAKSDDQTRIQSSAHIAFSGHTAFFSAQSALRMACSDKLTGVLRFFTHRSPTELFVKEGRILFATSRNTSLYCKNSPVILPATTLGLVITGQTTQSATGCPLFLYLSAHNGFPHDDVVQIVRDHGQRIFSHLWTAGRIAFEFEELRQLPEYAGKFPSSDEDPDNWIFRSLRFVRYEHLTAAQRFNPNGCPAYTRKGYELIQRMKLNEVESRFAATINGTEALPAIARKINIPLNDALLIVFRFSVLEIIDYWSSQVLSLPGETATGEGIAVAAS